MSRIKQSSWIPHHFEQIAANSTAATISSTAQLARLLLITVENQDARMRFDSTAPVASTGILLKTGQLPFVYDGYNGAPLKFVSSVTTAADITIASFTLPNS